MCTGGDSMATDTPFTGVLDSIDEHHFVLDSVATALVMKFFSQGQLGFFTGSSVV